MFQAWKKYLLQKFKHNLNIIAFNIFMYGKNFQYKI